ncbi:hypothetical protein ACU61A_41100 [Pseudonocardia sichuanensis]
MYGDTHVDPTPLFDPERGGCPPADAWDLYFHAPISLSLLGDAYAAHGMERELGQLLSVYADLAAATVTDVQRQGGYVAGGHRGRAIPARLEITAMAENAVPGEPTMRLHTHVYVGRTAIALDTGQRHPVDPDRLNRAADFAWTGYLTRLVNETTAVLGFIWAPLPGHTSGDVEIVDPPMAEHVPGHSFGICPGEYGPREQITTDAEWRTDVAESARLIAAERTRRTG